MRVHAPTDAQTELATEILTQCLAMRNTTPVQVWEALGAVVGGGGRRSRRWHAQWFQEATRRNKWRQSVWATRRRRDALVGQIHRGVCFESAEADSDVQWAQQRFELLVLLHRELRYREALACDIRLAHIHSNGRTQEWFIRHTSTGMCQMEVQFPGLWDEVMQEMAPQPAVGSLESLSETMVFA